MKTLIKKDTIGAGILLALGSEAVTALLLTVGLLLAGLPVGDHIRWYAVCFVAPLLLLRHCAKKGDTPMVTKTVIVVFFVTFIIYMYLLFRFKAIVL
ncbi:MAG: hypothetical protein IJK07_05255 [Bacteroidales bacterium]|nr:hypothetical protein [Bacteroidales bacterium]